MRRYFWKWHTDSYMASAHRSHLRTIYVTSFRKQIRRYRLVPLYNLLRAGPEITSPIDVRPRYNNGAPIRQWTSYRMCGGKHFWFRFREKNVVRRPRRHDPEKPTLWFVLMCTVLRGRSGKCTVSRRPPSSSPMKWLEHNSIRRRSLVTVFYDIIKANIAGTRRYNVNCHRQLVNKTELFMRRQTDRGLYFIYCNILILNRSSSSNVRGISL